MWTGWVGNDGQGGGPVIANDELGYGWPTYPERLQDAGVSWKIYQDAGDGSGRRRLLGLDRRIPYIGNYGDNSLLYFHQYQNAHARQPLYDRRPHRHRTQRRRAELLRHPHGRRAERRRLPQVSWIVAPEAYTEHPNWPAELRRLVHRRVLDALTCEPEVWARRCC